MNNNNNTNQDLIDYIRKHLNNIEYQYSFRNNYNVDYEVISNELVYLESIIKIFKDSKSLKKDENNKRYNDILSNYVYIIIILLYIRKNLKEKSKQLSIHIDEINENDYLKSLSSIEDKITINESNIILQESINNFINISYISFPPIIEEYSNQIWENIKSKLLVEETGVNRNILLENIEFFSFLNRYKIVYIYNIYLYIYNNSQMIIII